MASVAASAATPAMTAQPRARVKGLRIQLPPSIRTTSPARVGSEPHMNRLARGRAHAGTLARAAGRAGRALGCIRYGGETRADWTSQPRRVATSGRILREHAVYEPDVVAQAYSGHLRFRHNRNNHNRLCSELLDISRSWLC